MTERFTIKEVEIDDYVVECADAKIVIVDNGEIMKNNLEVVECLNNLHEENVKLLDERNYFERKKCEYFNDWNNAHLDNIQLRQENAILKREYNTLLRIVESII